MPVFGQLEDELEGLAHAILDEFLLRLLDLTELLDQGFSH
jgi:hypothetical protein